MVLVIYCLMVWWVLVIFVYAGLDGFCYLSFDDLDGVDHFFLCMRVWMVLINFYDDFFFDTMSLVDRLTG